MTRGRDSNEAWVVTADESTADALEVLADVRHQRWIDEPAIDCLPAAAVELE